MATEKAVNYTPEQTAAMIAAYTAEPNRATVDALAQQLGKTVRSVIAKLTREGVYKAKEYVSKTGEPVEKKDETADAIGKVLNLTENDTTSLGKANKTALRKVFAALANSVPREVESPADEAAKPALVETLRRVAGLTDDEARSLVRVSRATLTKLAAVFADESAD